MNENLPAGVWISTKDALPDGTDDILFHEIEYGWLLFGYFDVDNDDNFENDRTNCFYAVNESGPFEIEEIDYWMKFPELPKK